MRNVIATLLLSMVALSASAKNMYIPIAGVVRGGNNTFFRTDVRIFNPSATDTISVSIHYLPQGIEGTNISGKLVSVPPRQMVVLNDIVGTFFGEVAPALGALRLDSDTDASYEFIADSRIYTDSPNANVGGTYGQYVPALELSDAKLKTAVLHLSNAPEFRTNAGVMNPGTQPATVTASLHGADGTKLLDGVPVVIPPKSMRQLSIFELFGGAVFPDAYIAFESTQPVYTWGSVVDNRSGDQFYVRGIEDKAGRTPLEWE